MASKIDAFYKTKTVYLHDKRPQSTAIARNRPNDPDRKCKTGNCTGCIERHVNNSTKSPIFSN